MDINMGLDDSGQQEFPRKGITLIQVDCADQRLKGITKKRTLFVWITDHSGIEFNHLIKTQLTGKLVQVCPRYDLGSHFGQEALILVGIELEEQFSHHRT